LLLSRELDGIATIESADDLLAVRKLTAVISGLLALHLALLFVPARGAESHGATRCVAREAGCAASVGVVLDVGGRGDRSFNDGADAGARRAARTLGVDVQLVEPGESSDREAGLRLLAAQGKSLVIGVGFIFSDDLIQLAREYPQVRFAGVDFSTPRDSAGQAVPLPPNLAGLRFREEQGAFLVGALAALAGGSRILGFVGGMDIPLIHRFEAGYRAGVRSVCAECRVIAQYAGVTPEAFRDPGKGKELALSQYASGANVVFHASGSTGLGVFEAARQAGKLAIGVDADQWDAAPGHVLTSMVKGVAPAVYDQIARVATGTFHGGIFEYGLAEGGVGYVYDTHNRPFIPDSVRARVEKLARDIIAGRIVVPSS